MPGMDGLETARLLLQRHPDARIIMISSLAYDDTIDEAKRIGTLGFVYKPFDGDQVLLSIDNAFSASPGRPFFSNLFFRSAPDRQPVSTPLAAVSLRTARRRLRRGACRGWRASALRSFVSLF